MKDWIAFAASVPWFLERNAVAEVSASRDAAPLPRTTATLFPALAELIGNASLTEISVNSVRYELLAWDSINGHRVGWLCMPATKNTPRYIHPEHRELLASFGGIVERFNEPSGTWLLNLNEALTEREAAHDASFIREYQWAFEDADLTIPIDCTEYYSIAREANGNITLCHRTTGKIVMFAPDHGFSHVTVLEGCPAYTLYTINGAATFREWVNTVAHQWLEQTRSTKADGG